MSVTDDGAFVRDALSAGVVDFLGVSLVVEPGVLVPRRETELLGEEVVRLARARAAPVVVDVCCGAGNLGLAVAHHVPTARVFLSDLTARAVEVATRNRDRLGLGERVEVLHGDLLEPVRARVEPGTVDVLVCNPPYISSSRLTGDRRPLLDLEPVEAFDGGPYGLSIHQRVIREAPALLRPGGAVAFEIGAGQHRQLEALFRRAGTLGAPRFVNDPDGVPRVVVAERPT